MRQISIFSIINCLKQHVILKNHISVFLPFQSECMWPVTERYWSCVFSSQLPELHSERARPELQQPGRCRSRATGCWTGEHKLFTWNSQVRIKLSSWTGSVMNTAFCLTAISPCQCSNSYIDMGVQGTSIKPLLHWRGFNQVFPSPSWPDSSPFADTVWFLPVYWSHSVGSSRI